MALIKIKKLLADDEIMSHVFFNAISEVSDELLDEWRQKEGEEDKALNFKLTINGTSVPVEKFFNVLYEQYSEQVHKKATQIVKEQASEKLNEMIGKISDANQALEYALSDINWDMSPSDFVKK